jgi:molybdopterin/thiamine biosynthesis adenylyltransferase
MDKIETSNLSRQMLFYKGDEGEFKAQKAAERLQLMNPYLETEVYTIPLQKVPMEKYQECDVVVMALDNVQARMDLNRFCLKLGIPCIEGGTVGFEGHVQVIIPESTRDINGNPIPYGNREEIINRLVEDKAAELDEEQYPGYFNAQKDIEALEEKIDAIKETRIQPVLDEIKAGIEAEIDADPNKFMNFTPCYRCVLPVPPPPQNQVAACTLKGVPRTREHCAIRGEVLFIKKHNHNPDVDNHEEMDETLQYAQEELEALRQRVLEENISEEEKDTITDEEMESRKQNIFETFGGDFDVEAVEKILGNKIPAIQSVNAIISAIQSQEILKMIFLRNAHPIGQAMDPPYVNYNGVYGRFDAMGVLRREECVACGSNQGQENVQVPLSYDATINELFKGLQKLGLPIKADGWMITNPITKEFIYNPTFPAGQTGDKNLSEFEISNMSELTLTPFGKTKDGSEIKQYNVIIQML